jgi:hypothetical protein
MSSADLRNSVVNTLHTRVSAGGGEWEEEQMDDDDLSQLFQHWGAQLGFKQPSEAQVEMMMGSQRTLDMDAVVEVVIKYMEKVRSGPGKAHKLRVLP